MVRRPVAEWRRCPDEGGSTRGSACSARLTPDFEAEVPYTIATVESRRRVPRAFGRLEGSEPGAPGGAVVATFVDHAEWTELRFVPREDTR